MTDAAPAFDRSGALWRGRFTAMGSPCEVLVDDEDAERARRAVCIAMHEALRIERKYSRYRDDNIVHRINTAGGAALTVDDETADLLDFAFELYALSDGAFDISSGVLGRLWRFDGKTPPPDPAAVAALLALVGLHKARWSRPRLQLPAGMALDFGGIGKEYAVDRSTALLREAGVCALVNFGGDLAVTGPRRDGSAWSIGIERPPGLAASPPPTLALSKGGVATSGDTRRCIVVGARRYGHILDPRSGWPVDGAPRSVTVVAASCTEAGALATLGMLKGPDCERFLAAEGVQHWCLR